MKESWDGDGCGRGGSRSKFPSSALTSAGRQAGAEAESAPFRLVVCLSSDLVFASRASPCPVWLGQLHLTVGDLLANQSPSRDRILGDLLVLARGRCGHDMLCSVGILQVHSGVASV